MKLPKVVIDRPQLYVDIDQARENLRSLTRQLPDHCKVRLSSKSIRCPHLLRVLREDLGDRCRGLMVYHPREIPIHIREGWRDFIVAYPLLQKWDPQLFRQARVQMVADRRDYLDAIAAFAKQHQLRIPVMVDVDVATRFPGLHFGVRRSSLREPGAVLQFVQEIVKRPELEWAGVMTYEAQVAGVVDRGSGWLKSFILRQLKKIARRQVYCQRYELSRLLDVKNLVLNGGGSGSVHSTVHDPLVNEITLGSGILCPRLFENYDALAIKPALFYACPVVRHPDADTVVVYAGGYTASGSIESLKQPRVFAPQGWDLSEHEGLGEVQSPLRRRSSHVPPLELNDVVWFVPAKSGEIMERFQQLHFVSQGEVRESYPTYRGMGENYG